MIMMVVSISLLRFLSHRMPGLTYHRMQCRSHLANTLPHSLHTSAPCRHQQLLDSRRATAINRSMTRQIKKEKEREDNKITILSILLNNIYKRFLLFQLILRGQRKKKFSCSVRRQQRQHIHNIYS